ncbi:MAG TPA: rhomboid family intramembrane serine protease [Nitrososphaera sp.]|jgi:membrane associated rhomboid family serine protease/HSP20 family molecular chaperone IbpA|nr:rhomboid family intramembrane serine protease [Nitrososphaera sp.]
MFPIHDDTERVHGRPYLNYGMIAINVIVFIWEASATSFFSDERAVQEMFLTYGAVPDRLFDDFPASAPTILTSMFMHGGIAHIIGNMIFLFVFGDNIEDKYGRIKYILIYVGWGAAAALAHSAYAVSTGDGGIPAVGASGAISGVLGAYMVMFPRAKIFTVIAAFFLYTIRIPVLIYIPFWFVMQVVFALLGQLGGSGVAYLAHIGGFVAGVAVGLAWRALPDSMRYKGGIPSAGGAKPMFRNPMMRKSRPRIEDVALAAPEVIEGPDYYEVIAEIRGVSDASDISASYDADSRQVRIVAKGSRKYEASARLPDTAVNPVVKYIQYLNGIARIRLTK